MYNPQQISEIMNNSLYHSNEWFKSGRLDGARRSIQEAETWHTKRWTIERGRVLIGLDDAQQLIILDGRHLLQAYCLLQKDIPVDVIAFESLESQNLFNALYH